MEELLTICVTGDTPPEEEALLLEFPEMEDTCCPVRASHTDTIPSRDPDTTCKGASNST